MVKKNKIACFWIRFFSRLIDIIIFSIITIFFVYFLVKKQNGNIVFINPLNFYLWCLLSIVFLFCIFILIPIFLNGQTIGMWIFKIKIFFNNDKSKILSIIKREYFFSVAWIFNLFLLLLIINHTLINKIIVNQKNITYSNLESIRIGAFTSISSIIFFIQWFFTFSIMINKNKIGIHDKMSNSLTIYKNRFVFINKTKNLNSFKPYMIQNNKVEWANK